MLILIYIPIQHSAIPCEESCLFFLLFSFLFHPVSSTVSDLSLSDPSPVFVFTSNLPSLPLKTCGTLYFRWRGVYSLEYTTSCIIIAASSINFKHYDWVFLSDCFCSIGKPKERSSKGKAPRFYLKKILLILLASAVRDCGSACLVWPNVSNRCLPIERESDVYINQELFYVMPKHWK